MFLTITHLHKNIFFFIILSSVHELRDFEHPGAAISMYEIPFKMDVWCDIRTRNLSNKLYIAVLTNIAVLLTQHKRIIVPLFVCETPVVSVC